MNDDTGLPSISVIIPALNEEKLIKNALSQFTPSIKKNFNLEIIISDGGSTDNTLNIAKDFANEILRPISGEKQNISIGRNAGAKIAKSEIPQLSDVGWRNYGNGVCGRAK